MSDDQGQYEYPGAPFPPSDYDRPGTGPSAEKGQTDHKPSKSPLWQRLTFWSVIFNFFLVIITFLLMLIAKWQLDATNEAISTSKSANTISHEALRVSRHSTVISEEALRMSKESAEDAATNFHLEQRAWVNARNTDMRVFEVGELPRIRVTLTNSGRTPALQTKTLFGVALFDHEITDKDILDFENVEVRHLYQGITTLLPNGLLIAWAFSADKINNRVMTDIKAGKKLIFMLGKIVYTDVFKYVRTTRICMRYDPSANNFNHCNVYNDAD